MKNNILKATLLSAFLFVNLSVFAQFGGDGPSSVNQDGILAETGVESTSSNENMQAPINSNIYLLAGAGVLVGAYFFNRNKMVKV